MAVFSYGSKDKAQNIIVGIESNGKQFVIELSLSPTVGGKKLEINSIRNVFPKNNGEWLNWVTQGKLLRADKEKIQALIDKQRTILADVDYLDLESVTKIVKNFENPQLPEEKSLARDGGGAYSDAQLSYENDPWSKAWGESIRSKKQRTQFAEMIRKAMRERVNELLATLGVDIKLVEDGSGLEGKEKKAKGWYDTHTGKITVVLGNHKGIEDIEATILHEVVAHHGLRELFGDRFDSFLDAAYEKAEDRIKEQIDLLAIKNGWNRRVATEEYLAGLAEKTDFENTMASWWGKIKELFMTFLRNCGFSANMKLSDNELRYVLWMSWKNLQHPGAFRSLLGIAEKVAKEYELKTGEYAETRDTRLRSLRDRWHRK